MTAGREPHKLRIDAARSEWVQSIAVACILNNHARCDYDPDCRCDCHDGSPPARETT